MVNQGVHSQISVKTISAKLGQRSASQEIG